MLKSLRVAKCQLLPVMTVTTAKNTPLTKVRMDTKLPTYCHQCVTSYSSAEASYVGFIKVIQMASQALNLIKAVSTDVPPVNLPSDTPDFLKDFPGLTSGMGKYKDELARIHIDESVKPVAQPHYRIPFHARKHVEEKHKQLENDDIIECIEAKVKPLRSHQSLLCPSRLNRTR